MAKVSNWSWTGANKMVSNRSRVRLLKAADAIKDQVKANCPTGSISRPMYTTGNYAGQPWTARDAGELKRSIRVVERDEDKFGVSLAQFESIGDYGNIRIYAGHYLAWYARIVEFYSPYMRPALDSVRSQVKDILENG